MVDKKVRCNFFAKSPDNVDGQCPQNCVSLCCYFLYFGRSLIMSSTIKEIICACLIISECSRDGSPCFMLNEQNFVAQVLEKISADVTQSTWDYEWLEEMTQEPQPPALRRHH
eukprot:3969785-Amphidinium_carterae.1